MSLFLKIVQAGTDRNEITIPYIKKRHIRFSNTFNLFFFIISVILIILINLFNIEGGFKSYIRYVLMIPFCIFNIILNGLHYHITAKLLTVFVPFFFIFVFPIFNHYIYSGMFIWTPFGIMIIGSVSFFVFSFDNEKLLLFTSTLFFIIASIFYDKIIYYAIPNQLDLSFIYGDNYIYYQVSKIMLVSFLYASLYTGKIAHYNYRTRMDVFNRIVDQKNSELNYLNKNLEKKIKERTEKISYQNLRIKKLAYTNSHVVRALVARIIGLVNITYHNPTENEKEFCYKTIRQLALELDQETRKIARDLTEENEGEEKLSNQ